MEHSNCVIKDPRSDTYRPGQMSESEETNRNGPNIMASYQRMYNIVMAQLERISRSEIDYLNEPSRTMYNSETGMWTWTYPLPGVEDDDQIIK